jgi:hypothetical protein
MRGRAALRGLLAQNDAPAREARMQQSKLEVSR